MRILRVLCGAAVFLSLFAGPVSAGEAEDELERIRRLYAGLETYSAELTFNLYAGHQTAVVEETGQARLARSGDLYASRTFDVEMLLGHELAVLVDHESRWLMVDRRPPAAGPPPTYELDLRSILGEDADLDQLAAPIPGPRLEPLPGHRRALILDLPSGEHQRLRLEYDRRTHLINAVVLYFRDAVPIREGKPPATPRIEIRYQSFRTAPDFAPGTFRPARFFTLSADGELDLAEAYRGYRVINHLRPPAVPGRPTR